MMRGPVRVAAFAAVAVIVLSVGVVVGFRVAGTSSSSQGPTTAASPAPSATPSAIPHRARQSPGGGTIEVVEKGLSSYVDQRAYERVSYGIVLANTSTTHVAYTARVEIHVVGSDGRPAFDEWEREHYVWRLVGAILPGQTVGIGGVTYASRLDTVQLQVTVHDALWLPPDQGGPLWLDPVVPAEGIAASKITATGIRTERDPDSADMTLAFTVDSEYRVPVRLAAEAIFRNSDGVIIGGTGSRSGSSLRSYRPGRSAETVELSHSPPPPGVDDSKTAIYFSTSTSNDYWDPKDLAPTPTAAQS